MFGIGAAFATTPLTIVKNDHQDILIVGTAVGRASIEVIYLAHPVAADVIGAKSDFRRFRQAFIRFIRQVITQTPALRAER